MSITEIGIKIKKLNQDAVVPSYATEGASGFDLVATEDVVFNPSETKLVKTGLSIEVPYGFELQVRPRSGLSLKTPLRVANSPGTVDADYRGEICVIMTHTGSHSDVFGNGAQDPNYTIKKGDRIAQGVICPVIKAAFQVVESLDETKRGEKGFGSSGK